METKKITVTAELKPHTSQKSYYGKARATYYNDGSCILTSYDTDVCMIDKDNNFVRLWNGYSVTTMKHVNSFLALLDYAGGGKKWWDHLIVNHPYPRQKYEYHLQRKVNGGAKYETVIANIRYADIAMIRECYNDKKTFDDNYKIVSVIVDAQKQTLIKYYQVPEKYDQLYIPASGYTLIGGELVTEKEALKRCIKMDNLIPLPTVKAKDTFISFGVRKLVNS